MKNFNGPYFLVITASLIIILAGGFFSGCGGGGDGGGVSDRVSDHVEACGCPMCTGLWDAKIVIGPEGGTVEVVEPDGCLEFGDYLFCGYLHGVKIEIPEGTLTDETTVVVSPYGWFDPVNGRERCPFPYSITIPKEPVRYLPVGFLTDGPFMTLRSGLPFMQELEMTVPIREMPDPDDGSKIFCAFYFDADKNKWVAIPPVKIDGDRMTVKTNHAGVWSWGIIDLDRVEEGSINALMDEMMGDWNRLKSEGETKLRGLGLLDFENWKSCDGRKALKDLLIDLHASSKISISDVCETQNAVSGMECTVNHFTLTDPRMAAWIETEVRALFGRVFISIFGEVDYIGPLLQEAAKKMLLGQYQYAVEHFFDNCDYRYMMKMYDFRFYLDLLLYNVSLIAPVGIDVYEDIFKIKCL